MLTLFFWIAVALSSIAVISAFSDVWLGRSDPAGRGLASAYGWLLLPFPVVALLLFLLGRSHGFRVVAAVVAGLPLAAALLLSLASALGVGKARDPNLDRPELVVAAREPSREAKLRALLAAGTSPDTVLADDIGQPTPLLFHAMNTEAHGNVRAIVEAGARLDVRDPNGDLPLGRALKHRSFGDALLMIEHGAPLTGAQFGPQTLEEVVEELVPPEEGSPDHEPFTRIVEALRGKGVNVRVGKRPA